MMRYLFIFLIGIVSACRTDDPVVKEDINWTKENSTDLGKNIAIQEEIDIELFLEMHKDWEMVKTGSGLRYYIYEQGEVDSLYKPIEGSIAEIEYVITLLDGTECNRTEDDEYEEVRVDKSDIESGVQEALKKMSIGDKAKLIVPSHLGHGLVGDLKNIPPLTTLVMDIHLIGIRL